MKIKTIYKAVFIILIAAFIHPSVSVLAGLAVLYLLLRYLPVPTLALFTIYIITHFLK